MPILQNIRQPLLQHLLNLAGNIQSQGVMGGVGKTLQEPVQQVQPTDLISDTITKTVLKSLKKPIEEAMAQTDDPINMAKHIIAGVPVGTEARPLGLQQQMQQQQIPQQQLNMALAGQPTQTVGAQPQQNTIMDFLKTVLTATGEGIIGEENLLAQTQKRALEQEMRGEKPAQVGELQELILKETLNAEKAGLLKPQDLFTQFEKASQVFITTRDSQARIEAAATDPSAAGDLALIFNFMKVLDPGSTVREGEFASAQNSAGIPDRIRGTYNRVLQGKRLAPKQRIDFLDRSRKLFKAIEIQQNKTVKEFQKLGERNRIDPSVFMRDVGLAQQGQTSSGNTFRRIQ